jgi:hypothetical protein
VERTLELIIESLERGEPGSLAWRFSARERAPHGPQPQDGQMAAIHPRQYQLPRASQIMGPGSRRCRERLTPVASPNAFRTISAATRSAPPAQRASETVSFLTPLKRAGALYPQDVVAQGGEAAAA